MGLRWPLAVCVTAALAAWALSSGWGRPGPEPEPGETAAEADAPGRTPDLAAPAAAVTSPRVFESPPPARPGTRRLHLVGVGPPDRPAPDVDFEVVSRSPGEGGRALRTDHEPHRTARNEAWFALPAGVSMAWLRATADRGRLVSMEERTVEIVPDGPDPQVVRVPLFPAGELEVQVVDAGGRPISGARVIDHREAERGGPTDARGRTWIRGTAGPLFLHAVAAGHAASRPLSLDLAPGAREARTFVCGRARPVVGRAVDESGIALTGVIVAVGPHGSERRALESDGAFRFDSLPPLEDFGAILKLRVQEGERSASATVRGPSPAGEGPLDFGTIRFVSRWRVPVQVLSARGEPLAWASVDVVPAGGSPDPETRRLVTEETGTTFPLADGEYVVQAKPFVVRAPATFAVRGPWRGPPVPVVLEDALVVRGACIYRGDATPLWPMVMVRARAANPNDDIVGRLDAQGRFAFPLPAAMHDAPIEVETPYATLVSGLTAPKDESPLRVDLPPEQVMTLVVRAVDAQDRPVPFASAEFARVPPGSRLVPGWHAGPSNDGESSFWPVPRGDYRARVLLWDGAAASSETFTLERDGHVATVRFGR